MKFVQKLLMGIGGVAAAATLLTLVSPKAHAIVATLVEVTNTRSAPVPNQDVDVPGRHPFASTCRYSLGSTDACGFAPVPANTELVIQTISVIGNTGAGPWPLGVGQMFASTGGGPAYSFFFPVAPSGFDAGTAIQSLTAYADPGSTPTCQVQAPIALPKGTVNCTITGYTVSLP